MRMRQRGLLASVLERIAEQVNKHLANAFFVTRNGATHHIFANEEAKLQSLLLELKTHKFIDLGKQVLHLKTGAPQVERVVFEM